VQLGVDQCAGREGQPDPVLDAALVVEREQLVEHLLDRLARVAGAIECGDAALDPLDHQSHGEGEQLGLGGEVVAQRPG
jgi:hypothetical protein